jgi:hypothetical protein
LVGGATGFLIFSCESIEVAKYASECEFMI